LLTVTLLMSIITTLDVVPTFATDSGTPPTPAVNYDFQDSGATAILRHGAILKLWLRLDSLPFVV